VAILRIEMTTLMAHMDRIQKSIKVIRNGLCNPGEADQHD
jgi:hypothetical protein